MKINGIEVHPDVCLDVILDAVQARQEDLSNPGFCIACGAEADNCEPDARGHECEACGAPCVYGADELLLHMVA